MDENNASYLTIGQFATAAKLTIKALRLNHDLRLLPPAYVDPFTSYRYYTTHQIRAAEIIRMLREIDMPLEKIRAALSSEPTNEGLLDVVKQHLASSESRLQTARETARQLQTYLSKEQEMSFAVTSQKIPTQRVITRGGHIKVDRLDDYIVESLDLLKAQVAANGGKVNGTPMGIYHGPINNEDDGPLQVAVPVDAALKIGGEYEITDLAGGEFAVAEARGADCTFPAILGAYDAVAHWIRNQGREMVGSPREVWHEPFGKKAHMQIMWQYK
jgi:DNA-binding transcriptional MerR regulator